MLSSALVVFREVFEIVLIVGIVLVATRAMPHRRKAIAIGFAGGILGSALVAVFTGQISAMAEGMGQEIFNACILFTAAAFIGWTVIWMKRHGREMKARFEQIEKQVELGRVSFLSLSAVIAITMLREGAEIVLFTYGMLASGQSVAAISAGCALGLVGGLTVGILLYKGLIKLPTRIFFQTTSWLLVLLVAGMAVQGTGFLTAAGYFSSLSQTVWDTSAFLSDGGMVGTALKTLVGYTATPSVIQLIVYVFVLGLMAALMKVSSGPSKNTPPVSAGAAA